MLGLDARLEAKLATRDDLLTTFRVNRVEQSMVMILAAHLYAHPFAVYVNAV